MARLIHRGDGSAQRDPLRWPALYPAAAARPGGRLRPSRVAEAVGYLLAEWLALKPGPLYHLLAQALEAHAIQTGEKQEDVDQL